MRVNNNDQRGRKQDAKAARLRRLAVIEEAVSNVRQGVVRCVRTSRSILALQRVRGDIAAFEAALTVTRLRKLEESAPSRQEAQLVSDLAPLIARQAAQRSTRQGRIKWSSR